MDIAKYKQTKSTNVNSTWCARVSHGSDLVKRGRRPKHAQTRFSAHRSYEGGQSHGWVLGPRAMNINMQHISTSSPNMFHHVLSSFHGKIWEMYTRSFFSECAWQASPTEIHLKLHDSRMGSDTHTPSVVWSHSISFNRPCPCNSWVAAWA